MMYDRFTGRGTYCYLRVLQISWGEKYVGCRECRFWNSDGFGYSDVFRSIPHAVTRSGSPRAVTRLCVPVCIELHGAHSHTLPTWLSILEPNRSTNSVLFGRILLYCIIPIVICSKTRPNSVNPPRFASHCVHNYKGSKTNPAHCI